MYQLIDIVTGGQLTPGSLVSKEIDGKRHEVGLFTGMCEHGLHFDNGCYDFIGRWYVWEVVVIKEPDNLTKFTRALLAGLRENSS